MSLERIGAGGVIFEAEGPLSGGKTPDTWSSVASLGTGRERVTSAEANGLVYAIGGYVSGVSALSSVEEYDPDTDTWTTVASLSSARQRAAAAEANGLVYAIGGQDADFNALATVEEYDPDADTWTTVASLNTERSYPAAAEAYGKLYATGGDTSSANSVASVEEYDPDADTWTTVVSMNTGRSLHGSATAGGKVYVVAGKNANDSNEELVFDELIEDVFTATGDTLVGIDDPNGKLRNRDTGRELTGDELIARDGETIAAITDVQARVYRTEET